VSIDRPAIILVAFPQRKATPSVTPQITPSGDMR
jgi:hypothetical protein